MTEQLHFHFSLSCVGEGNGNPLQCSCLENPRDGGAWWVAVYGVAQSRPRLKRLSSSSGSIMGFNLWRPCFHWDWIFLKTTEVKSVIVTKGKGPSGLIFWRLTIGDKHLILLLIGSGYPCALEAIWGNGCFAMGNIVRQWFQWLMLGISVSISCSFIHLFPGSFYQLAQMWARRGRETDER